MRAMTRTTHRVFLWNVLAVVGANYLAQVPYYLDVHYLPSGALPSLRGVLLLGATLVWFLAGWLLLARGSRGNRVGYWVLLSFLAVEVVFYLYNIVNQVAHGFPPFLHLQARDPVLWVVFNIGYLNMLCGLYFLYFLVRHRSTLAADGAGARASAPARMG